MGGTRTRGARQGAGWGVASPRGGQWPLLTDGRACVGWCGAQRQLARAGWHFRSRVPGLFGAKMGCGFPCSSLVARNWAGWGFSFDPQIQQALGSSPGSPSPSSGGPGSCLQLGSTGSGQPAANGHPSGTGTSASTSGVRPGPRWRFSGGGPSVPFPQSCASRWRPPETDVTGRGPGWAGSCLRAQPSVVGTHSVTWDCVFLAPWESLCFGRNLNRAMPRRAREA